MTPGPAWLSRSAALIAGGWVAIMGLNVSLLPKRYALHAEVETVKRAPLRLIVRASGSLEAKDSNTVKVQFDGPVRSKLFREGQAVKKGQLLAVIGRERIRLDFQSKKDMLINAEADLAHARRDLQLQRALFKKEAVAYSAVDDAQRALTKAEQGLRNAQEAFRLAQSQWNSSQVVAPIDGTVVKDWIGDDKFVANGKELVTVADVSEYTVHAKVDELDIHSVHEGQKAEVKIAIFPDKPLSALVSEVGSQVEGNGLPEISVILKLTDTRGLLLRPKLTAESRIFTGITEPVVSVPLTALANTEGFSFVWTLNALNRLVKTRVVEGRSNPDRIEIKEGLKPGDRVCAVAEPDFAEGARIVIGSSSASQAGSRTARFLPPPPSDADKGPAPGARRRPRMGPPF